MFSSNRGLLYGQETPMAKVPLLLHLPFLLLLLSFCHILFTFFFWLLSVVTDVIIVLGVVVAVFVVVAVVVILVAVVGFFRLIWNDWSCVYHLVFSPLKSRFLRWLWGRKYPQGPLMDWYPRVQKLKSNQNTGIVCEFGSFFSHFVSLFKPNFGHVWPPLSHTGPKVLLRALTLKFFTWLRN